VDKQRSREEGGEMSATDDVIRAFPHALGPEKSLLSSMLQDPQEYIPRALDEKLTESYFYLPSHSILFGFLIELFECGMEIELVSLVQRLLDRGLLDRVGGPSSLTDLYTYAPSPGHFHHHLQHVKDKYVLRQIINLGTTTTAAAYDAPDEAMTLLADVERQVASIADIATGAKPPLSLRSIIEESLDRFTRRARGQEETHGISTISLLDQHLRGAHPGRMWVIGAYPEGGKSVMASQIVLDAVLEGHPCLFLSLEMAERDLMDRMIVQASRIDAKAFTEPKSYARENGGEEISTGLMRAIQRVIPRLIAAPLRLQRPANRNLSTILTAIRRAHREMAIKIAVLDYVQLVKGAKADTKEAEVSEVSHALQEIAGDLGITMIVLSQLNADGDTKHGRVIEEDADAVINIIQDRNKDSATYKQHRHVLIAKDRHYGTGGERVRLILDRARIRFVEGMDETTTVKKPQFNR
jgi:replicative DNA helicase